MASHGAATAAVALRAQLFMRQCRSSSSRKSSILIGITKRSVSSSHLAPSNFSRPLHFREAEPTTNVSQVDKDNGTTPDHRLPDPSSFQFRQQQKHFQRNNATRPAVSSVVTPIPAGFLNFVKYRLLNLPVPRPPVEPARFSLANNPYRARKSWPPDFRRLSTKQQFHFEKTWRRRLILKNKSQRYNFNRYVRLLQQSLIVLSLIYFVFIADPYVKEGGGTPLDGFRAWFFGQFAKNEHISEGLKEQARELQAYYSRNWNRKDDEREEVVARAMESNMASSQAVLEKRGIKATP